MLLVAAVLMAPAPVRAIEKYSDPAAVNRKIEQLRQANPSLVKVQKLAVTPGGREMLMMIPTHTARISIFLENCREKAIAESMSYSFFGSAPPF